MTRGFYYFYKEVQNFIPCLKITELVKKLEKLLQLNDGKKELLLNELYQLAANYDIELEFCWLKAEETEKGLELSWGTSPLIKMPGLTNQALIAVYYVWKTANCTPEEASKVLGISVEDLMKLSYQFESLNK